MPGWGWAILVSIVIIAIIGGALVKDEKPEQQTAARCPQCGAETWGQICDKCGTQLDPFMNC